MSDTNSHFYLYQPGLATSITETARRSQAVLVEEMRRPITSKDLYCRVCPSRGRGDTTFRIARYGKEECLLQDGEGGEKFTMYTVHLYTSLELIKKSKDDRSQTTAAIGLPKVKPGKR